MTPPALPASSPAKPRVLVVDDDKAVRESLRRSLEFNGYAVALASDGAEALAGIAGHAPDVVVMDVMMPRLDGIETTKSLRKAGNDVPILVLTARDAVGDRVGLHQLFPLLVHACLFGGGYGARAAEVAGRFA